MRISLQLSTLLFHVTVESIPIFYLLFYPVKECRFVIKNMFNRIFFFLNCVNIFISSMKDSILRANKIFE